MDNRLKFLYCHVTELWGRREERRAGNEETGASEVPAALEKPCGNGKT